MRMGIASLLAALFLAGAAWAQPAGTWLLVDRKEVINGPNERVAPNCNWRGDSGDKGMRLYISCYSSVSRATVVSSAAVSWEFPIGFERLRVGSLVPLAGVIDNASTPKTGPSATCGLRWNYSLRITTGGTAEPSARARCEGTFKVPGPGLQRSGELITEAVLVQDLGFGSGTGIQRILVYRWTPDGTAPPSAAAPAPVPPPLVASAPAPRPPAIYSGRYLGCFADRVQRDLTGPSMLQPNPQACISTCGAGGFRYASMQAGRYCFCGNSYGRYGPSTACVACPEAAGETCGGQWANAVWEVSGAMSPLPPAPATTAAPATASLAGEWTYDPPNGSVRVTQSAGQVRLEFTQRRWQVAGPHYEFVGTLQGRALTGRWHNVTRDFNGAPAAMVAQFGPERCRAGGAGHAELSDDGASVRFVAVEDPCGEGWNGLVMRRR